MHWAQPLTGCRTLGRHFVQAWPRIKASSKVAGAELAAGAGVADAAGAAGVADAAAGAGVADAGVGDAAEGAGVADAGGSAGVDDAALGAGFALGAGPLGSTPRCSAVIQEFTLARMAPRPGGVTGSSPRTSRLVSSTCWSSHRPQLQPSRWRPGRLTGRSWSSGSKVSLLAALVATW